MERVLQVQHPLRRWKRLPGAVLALTLGVLAATILLTTLDLRHNVREQIAGRDGEILQAVSHLQQIDDQAGQELVGSLEDPTEQFDHILKIAHLDGVFGVRLFSREGVFVNAFPAYIEEAGALPKSDLLRLRAMKPVSHFQPRAAFESVYLLAPALDDPARPVPLLFVNVPLHATDQGREHLVGVAQFIMQGESIAREYAALDRNLALQAAAGFLVGGGIITATLLLAFRRIQRANAQLSTQAERLLHANQELALAAKTAAVGAVTSHLIHGLKNPLSGLQGFVKSHRAGEATGTDADWKDALASTQRMQALISGVVRVLEDQQALGDYEISLRELVEIISARMQPVARAAGIHFFTETTADVVLGNREANLAILILENLIQNALQATPQGKTVRLVVVRAEKEIRCEVQDEGSGIAPELQPALFTPCRSTKPGGSGIGLAISRQLALNIGAELRLARSSAQGCVFQLVLPEKLAAPLLTPAETAAS